MSNYDYYNREERAMCAHLFRLLHEKFEEKKQSNIGQFIDILAQRNLIFRNGKAPLRDIEFKNMAIYCEVAIIRDAYHNKKPDVHSFMDDLTHIIMRQENVHQDCRLYSMLPEPLNNINLTHPKQIRQKADSLEIQLNESERKVYGAMQGMFNAKPDLAITIDNVLLVCEAKLTESFNDTQLKRTWNIAEVWATLLYEDFGFQEAPVYSVFKLGGSKFNPHINWTDIYEIAQNTYNNTDRTRIAIKAGLDLLKQQNIE